MDYPDCLFVFDDGDIVVLLGHGVFDMAGQGNIGCGCVDWVFDFCTGYFAFFQRLSDVVLDDFRYEFSHPQAITHDGL